MIGKWHPRRLHAGLANASRERIGVLFAVIAALGFSFKAILVKLAYLAAPVEAITLLGLRMAFSLPFFLWVGFSSSRKAPPIPRRDWIALIVLGLLGYYASSILDFIGLKYITAGLERLILFTYPTLAVLISVLFLGHRLHRLEVFAILLSYFGIGLACAHDLTVSAELSTVLIGAGFVFGASLTFAIYLAGSAPLIQRLGSARFTALAMVVSTVAIAMHFLVTEPFTELVQPWPIYAYGAAMALLSTVLPAFLLSAAIDRIGSPRTVLIGTLGPVLTIFFSWWLLHEPLSVEQIIGTVLVVVGVILVGKKR